MPRKRRGGSRGGSGSALNSPNSDNRSTPGKQPKHATPQNDQAKDDVFVARGRFRGALLNAMEYNVEDSDSSVDHSPIKRERNWDEYKISSQTKRDLNDYSSDEDYNEKNHKRSASKRKFRKIAKNNSYVMKLFDRSVDLAQFTEDTPLYPICRAWMANKPRSNERSDNNTKNDEPEIEDGVRLPPPEGHPVSRVPPLLPEQCARSKYNFDLNFNNESPVPREVLLKNHLNRWHAVRRKWYHQSIIYESRYAKTQEILNEMDANS